MSRMGLIVTAALCAAMSSSGMARASGEGATERIEQAKVTVEFRRTPLESAIGEIARQAGVNVAIDWPSLREARIAGDTSITMSLIGVKALEALEAVLHGARRGEETLEWWAGNEVVHVTTRTGATRQAVTLTYSCRAYCAEPMSTRERQEIERAVTSLWRSHFAVFAPPWRGLPNRWDSGASAGVRVGSRREVKELLDALQDRLKTRRMEELAETIRAAVSPESWRERGGTVGTVRVAGDRLVITQSPVVHRRIGDMLRSIGITSAFSRSTGVN